MKKPKCSTCGTVKHKYNHTTVTAASLEGNVVTLTKADGSHTKIYFPSTRLLKGLGLDHTTHTTD